MRPQRRINNEHASFPENLLLLVDRAEFPASRMRLVNIAAESGASTDALNAFQALPKSEYATLHELSSDLGLIRRIPGQENLFSSNPPPDQPL